MKAKPIKYNIGGIATTYRGINIYHATTEQGRKGYRITSVISKRFFATVEAAKKVILSHDTKLGYGKVKR